MRPLTGAVPFVPLLLVAACLGADGSSRPDSWFLGRRLQNTETETSTPPPYYYYVGRWGACPGCGQSTETRKVYCANTCSLGVLAECPPASDLNCYGIGLTSKPTNTETCETTCTTTTGKPTLTTTAKQSTSTVTTTATVNPLYQCLMGAAALGRTGCLTPAQSLTFCGSASCDCCQPKLSAGTTQESQVDTTSGSGLRISIPNGTSAGNGVSTTTIIAIAVAAVGFILISAAVSLLILYCLRKRAQVKPLKRASSSSSKRSASEVSEREESESPSKSRSRKPTSDDVRNFSDDDVQEVPPDVAEADKPKPKPKWDEVSESSEPEGQEPERSESTSPSKQRARAAFAVFGDAEAGPRKAGAGEKKGDRLNVPGLKKEKSQKSTNSAATPQSPTSAKSKKSAAEAPSSNRTFDGPGVPRSGAGNKDSTKTPGQADGKPAQEVPKEPPKAEPKPEPKPKPQRPASADGARRAGATGRPPEAGSQQQGSTSSAPGSNARSADAAAPAAPAPSPEAAAVADLIAALDRELDMTRGKDLETKRKTFKALQLKWHPDKNPDKPEQAAEVFKHLMGRRGGYLDA